MIKFSAGLLLLMMAVPLHAQDQRGAVIAALRRWGMTRPVDARQVEFTLPPACTGADDSWKVNGAHFDPVLHAWAVEVSCSKCAVPFLVIVQLDGGQPLKATVTSKKNSPVLVRAGERRVLTVKFPAGRITQPVVCLRNGRAGDEIRVRSLDRRVVRRVLVGDKGELILSGWQ